MLFFRKQHYNEGGVEMHVLFIYREHKETT